MALIGLCQASQLLGPRRVEYLVHQSDSAGLLASRLAAELIESAGSGAARSLAIALDVGYSHPGLVQAALGRSDIPTGPCMQILSDGWMRIFNYWRSTLKASLGEWAINEAALRRAAGYLLDLGAVEAALRLYFELGDRESALQVIAGQAGQMLRMGQWETLNGWLERLSSQGRLGSQTNRKSKGTRISERCTSGWRVLLQKMQGFMATIQDAVRSKVIREKLALPVTVELKSLPPPEEKPTQSQHALKDAGGALFEESSQPAAQKPIWLMSPAPQPVPSPAPTHKPSLVIYCLGPLRVYQNEDLIENWPSRKAEAILKYLASRHPAAVSKDILMNTFWPAADPEAARRNLHQAIYSLRQSLRLDSAEFHPILFDNDTYRLNPAIETWIDFKEFERHTKVGQSLERINGMKQAAAEYHLAIEIYQGDLFASDLYEEWMMSLRQYLHQSYLHIAGRLSQYYLEFGDYPAAIALSLKILSFDNAQEEAHQIIMKSYLAQGQRHLALQQYQYCAKALKSGLDVSPSPETEALYSQILEEAGRKASQ